MSDCGSGTQIQFAPKKHIPYANKFMVCFIVIEQKKVKIKALFKNTLVETGRRAAARPRSLYRRLQVLSGSILSVWVNGSWESANISLKVLPGS